MSDSQSKSTGKKPGGTEPDGIKPDGTEPGGTEPGGTEPVTNLDTAPLTYRDSGVDIDAGNKLVELIKPLARSTRRAGADADLGGFGALFDLARTGYRDPVLVAANDGVGTKLKIAIDTGFHGSIGIDLVAMCVNDLIVQGAEPLFFLDYFSCGKLDLNTAEAVISGIAEGCRLAGCALIGGETAEMPGMYHGSDYDLAGFSVGAVERDAILPRRDVAAGDVLLGLSSSGPHSNGYSLIRRLVDKEGLGWDAPAPFAPEQSLGEALITPTRIYVNSVLKALRHGGGIKALAHITGGGLLENIPRVLPHGITARIDLSSWRTPAVFQWLQQAGRLETTELVRTFNAGIGMIVVTSPDSADTVATLLRDAGENVTVIGELLSSGARHEHVTLTGKLEFA